MMDLENTASCSICIEPYGNNVRPRNLPCGHVFCTACLTNFLSDGRIVCPNCKRPHSASSAMDFPIIHALETVSDELSEVKEEGNDSAVARNVSEAGPSKKKWHAVFKEEKDSLQRLIQSGEDKQKDIADYKDFLHQRKEGHEKSVQVYNALALQNEEIIKMIASEEKFLAESVKEWGNLQNKAESTLKKFQKVSSLEELMSGSEAVETCQDKMENWNIKLQKQCPSIKTIRNSEKMVNETKDFLSQVCIDIDEDTDEDFFEEDPSSLSLMKKLELIKQGKRETFMDANARLGITENVRMALRTGLVYAIQYKDGNLRSARVTSYGGKVYLHHLQNKPPPANTHKIQHSDLLGTLKTDSVVAFMDFSSGNQQRMHISLSPDTPLGRHFQVLCTGILGPVYANSNMLEIEDCRGQDARIYGGDYEKNNGMGGAPLFGGLNPMDEIYRRPVTMGIVWARYEKKDGPRIAQFAISNKNNLDKQYMGVFVMTFLGELPKNDFRCFWGSCLR
ncbi:hypothetical protein SK128_014824 [Halocaridina rubra]|uniref:RING-type domain-containing protein n=1 Tax=Halocaridina rubra TaxID=373956 RepID=A0AAN8WB53_HALRR